MNGAPVRPAGASRAAGAAGSREAAALPRLHAIAADAILDRPGFAHLAGELLAAGGPALALHLRAHARPGGALFALANVLAPVARAAGALLVVNDRLDVALGAGAGGVQLGARSLPLDAARRVAGTALRLGRSVHATQEAAAAARDGADWLLLGTIYATASHPGRAGAGLALVSASAALTGTPIVAIGGVMPGRVPELVEAGAHGVAVLRGIWEARDPAAAAAEFLGALAAASASMAGRGAVPAPVAGAAAASPEGGDAGTAGVGKAAILQDEGE